MNGGAVFSPCYRYRYVLTREWDGGDGRVNFVMLGCYNTCMATYADVEGFPGYRVGDDGSVWSRRTPAGTLRSEWKRLKVRQLGGVAAVVLSVNGQKAHRAVAHLVLEAFVEPRPEGMEACHFPDEDIFNNQISNLRWDTHANNILDKVRSGTVARGERHGSAKLTDAEVAEMRRLRAESEQVRREEVERRKQLGIRTSKHESGRWRKLPPMLSYRALGERFGVSAPQAHAICAGKYWRQE